MLIYIIKLFCNSFASLHLHASLMMPYDIFEFDGPSIIPYERGLENETPEEIKIGHPLYHVEYEPNFMEFTLYLKMYDIDFPKKKDGFPHMGYKINKIHMKKF